MKAMLIAQKAGRVNSNPNGKYVSDTEDEYSTQERFICETVTQLKDSDFSGMTMTNKTMYSVFNH